MEIVINADDFGMSREVNKAIQYCFEHNLIQQTSLMVNMPFADEAVNIAKQGGFADRMGLHLNLVEGKPLSERIKHTSFCNTDGYLNGTIMNGKKRLFLSREEKDAVAEEISAQVSKFMGYGCNLHHVDSHRHAHTNYPILKLVLSLLGNTHECTIRLARNIPKDALHGAKGFYKRVINKKIALHNNKCKKGLQINGFGSIGDYDEYREQRGKDKTIEIMIHPTICNGQLNDAINEFSVEDWIKRG